METDQVAGGLIREGKGGCGGGKGEGQGGCGWVGGSS